MNAALAHRGPDAENVWIQKGVHFGHKRLSIIDLSDAGVQPMHSVDGRYVMVFNGEIYNYRQLKAELKSYPFHTETDSEVILAAYNEWGKKFLDRLNGMFALAIYDKYKDTLLLARDRLGIKPLYYYKTEEFLVFSSEIRALLASELVPRRLSIQGLNDYLRYQTVHAPQTILDQVQMLLPGHSMVLVNNELSINQYWNPVQVASLSGQVDFSYATWKSKLYETLTAAVDRRLVADVPLGAFLSGGIDSSIIVGLMSELRDTAISTFNVAFAEEAFSEAPYARVIAKKFGTHHHEIKLSPDTFLENLPYALKAMDHPSGDGPNTYTVAEQTKKAGITVALSGLGGDELFAGYPIFKRSYQLDQINLINKVPRVLRKSVGSWMQAYNGSIAYKKKAAVLNLKQINGVEAYPIARQVLLEDEVIALLGANYNKENAVRRIINDMHLEDIHGSLSKVSLMEFRTYLQNILLRDTDQMSMAHALEVRVPFLDHELVELLLQVPDKFKYPKSPKQLLVESVGEILPKEVVNRPKMGFTLPFSDWMKNELHNFCDQHIQALAGRSFITDSIIIDLWRRFLKGDPSLSWSRLWHLIVLENWLAQNDIH